MALTARLTGAYLVPATLKISLPPKLHPLRAYLLVNLTSHKHVWQTTIAINRGPTLPEYVSSGTLVNAELSTSLLSLFYPGNPLHDGAVMIRGASIVAAGCVLPLSPDSAHFKLKGACDIEQDWDLLR